MANRVQTDLFLDVGLVPIREEGTEIVKDIDVHDSYFNIICDRIYDVHIYVR